MDIVRITYHRTDVFWNLTPFPSFPIKIAQIPARKALFSSSVVHDLFIFIVQSSSSRFVLHTFTAEILSAVVQPNTCDQPK